MERFHAGYSLGRPRSCVLRDTSAFSRPLSPQRHRDARLQTRNPPPVMQFHLFWRRRGQDEQKSWQSGLGDRSCSAQTAA